VDRGSFSGSKVDARKTRDSGPRAGKKAHHGDDQEANTKEVAKRLRIKARYCGPPRRACSGMPVYEG
jgi:hypothetical protein